MPPAPLPRSLGVAVREFLRFGSPRTLIAFLVVALALRVYIGGWSWADLIAVAVVIVVQPFLEWTLHVFVLHARPQQVRGRTFDTVVARDHRLHHADPRDLPLIFIPRRWCWYLVGSVLLVGLLFPSWPLRASFWVAAFAMAVIYEWSHFLIHTDYKPKSRAYRHLYTNHRLHHYRNENYWFGITSTVGDQILRTDPAKDDVPVSPTAKDLLGVGSARSRRVPDTGA
jgi:hypothetical protein